MIEYDNEKLIALEPTKFVPESDYHKPFTKREKTLIKRIGRGELEIVCGTVYAFVRIEGCFKKMGEQSYLKYGLYRLYRMGVIVSKKNRPYLTEIGIVEYEKRFGEYPDSSGFKTDNNG